MNKKQWEIFCAFKAEFRTKVQDWHDELACSGLLDELKLLQKEASDKDGVPFYPLSDPFVYNESLEDISINDDMKLIVIGDNPGKNEQLIENRRYLVGQSGKIAENFFARNPDLGINFRKNVIILNKTPLHTAKTKELNFLAKADATFAQLIHKSQIWCAKSTAKLHIDLLEASKTKELSLWLVGYAELKGKGLFIPYRDELLQSYKGTDAWDKVFVYQHFSMNRFLIDLGQKSAENCSLGQNLNNLGRLHRIEIFG